MTTPSSLVAFYDRLVRHDWTYAYSDDGSVFRRGEAERSALVREAKQSPEAQALFDAYLTYSNTRMSNPAAQPPARPEEGASVAPAPAPVDMGVLAELDEADQARVRQAANPTAVLAQIQARQALDAVHPLENWLPELGATQDARSPNRWNFADGSQVRIKGEGWIHFVPQGQLKGQLTMVVPEAQGQGVVRLVARLWKLDEAQAMAQVQGSAPRIDVLFASVPPAVPAPVSAAPQVTVAPPAPTPPVAPSPGIQRPTRRFGRG